jgi:hypothetical protein
MCIETDRIRDNIETFGLQRAIIIEAKRFARKGWKRSAFTAANIRVFNVWLDHFAPTN